MAGPRGRDRHAAPPPAVRRRREGTRGPPPSPPPPRLRPMSERRQTEETAAPHPPRSGRCTRGAGAPRQRQTPARPARCRLTADRRRPGRLKRSGPIRGRPREDGGANQGGGVPPPLARPHWPVGGRPDGARRPWPPGNPHGTSIPRGGTAETRDGRPTPDGAGGRGGGGHPPPPAPPTQFGSHRSGPPPPRSRGDAPPPPRRDRDAGGGGAGLDLHTARPSAPSRLLPRGSRPQGEPTPACRSNVRTKLGGGARRRTGTVWRPRPT